MASRLIVLVIETEGAGETHQDAVQAKLDLLEERDEIFDVAYVYGRKEGSRQRHSTQIIFRRYSGNT